jgi:hypothetical protein
VRAAALLLAALVVAGEAHALGGQVDMFLWCSSSEDFNNNPYPLGQGVWCGQTAPEQTKHLCIPPYSQQVDLYYSPGGRYFQSHCIRPDVGQYATDKLGNVRVNSAEHWYHCTGNESPMTYGWHLVDEYNPLITCPFVDDPCIASRVAALQSCDRRYKAANAACSIIGRKRGLAAYIICTTAEQAYELYCESQAPVCTAQAPAQLQTPAQDPAQLQTPTHHDNRRAAIKALIVEVLGRHPKAGEVDYWDQSGLGLPRMKQIFLDKDEYKAWISRTMLP